MQITRVEKISKSDLIEKLRTVRIVGHGQVGVYRAADINLSLLPIDIEPTQTYVMRSIMRRTRELADAFAIEGIDIFELDGGINFWVAVDIAHGREIGPIPLLPPVVELSCDANGGACRIIADGMHRITMARALGRRHIRAISVCYPLHPYYAYPLPGSWADVTAVDVKPEGDANKNYREPENHKALFRDFNAVFPGVQVKR